MLRIKSNGVQRIHKKVIFVLVDSLMAQAIDRGLKQNKLPAFRFLIDHGQYYTNMVSSFPTMSVTIDSSLLTGTFPDKHRLPGLSWYSPKEKKVISYGSGPLEVMKHGVITVLSHALIDLNQKHLNPAIPTLHEELHHMGLTSGSINGLVYRGAANHRLTLPLPLGEITTLPKEISVKGPDFFTLGALSNPLAGIKDLPVGPTEDMGMNNKYAVETASYLVKTKKLPDFLLVYLPDLDGTIHKNGPSELEGVIKADQSINSLLQSFGSPEKAIKETIFIVAGDSGMSQVLPVGKDAVVHLPSLLQNFNVLQPGEDVSDATEIVLGVNDTMSYVYNLKKSIALRKLAEILRTDKRIDTISWAEKDWIYSMQGGSTKELRFKKGGTWVDSYDQKWTVSQDVDVLDLRLKTSKHKLSYGKYPDVLQRIYSSLHSHAENLLVVTAKPGYELAETSSPTHRSGGAHGGLDESASLVPLIINGTDQKPEHLRIVDLKRFLIKLLSEQKK